MACQSIQGYFMPIGFVIAFMFTLLFSNFLKVLSNMYDF